MAISVEFIDTLRIICIILIAVIAIGTPIYVYRQMEQMTVAQQMKVRDLMRQNRAKNPPKRKPFASTTPIARKRLPVKPIKQQSLLSRIGFA
jgi:hypothetical protein